MAADAQAVVIAGITFKASAVAYIEAHEASWRNDKHRAQWSATLKTFVYPTMGDIAVADIDTGHVMRASARREPRSLARAHRQDASETCEGEG